MIAPSHPMIELRRLHRFFGTTRAVQDVSFAVERGQVFGFIGPNGAGKTTSMRVLATLDLPTAGDAFVDVSLKLRSEPRTIATGFAMRSTRLDSSVP